MKEQVKNLWKLCFTDSDEFMDMYFSLRYREELNLAIREKGKVVSALQMIPYPMTFCEQIVDTSYISGACTHPEERSHGFMKELLTQSFERMYQQKVAFSTLIPAEPWLFDYYNRLGYSTVFHYSECTVPVSGAALLPTTYQIHSTTDLVEEVYDYFRLKMLERPCCVQHLEADFAVVLADMSLAEGRVYWLSEDKQIKALAIIYKEKGKLQVKELLGNSQEEKELLLSAIGQENACGSLTVIQPVSEGCSTFKLGMARIIHTRQVLSVWASCHPHAELYVHLTDAQLPPNSGYYQIRKGECIYSEVKDGATYIEMDVAGLTDHILSPLSPYMSLMLN
ncbi:MAG: GNAT family N-acetyltransferase [Bacteroides sp.]|nr:GNAT family N-acetyltransferase [Bacteroides sp.]